jgi:pseudouridylate synthase
VVAQGLPHPTNLEVATACEQAVRDEGAIPAATAVIAGGVRVGLTHAELEGLATGGARVRKLGARDLAAAIALRQTGGTTVSATCAIAASAGIRVFATGGIGGVHRGANEHFDISQDLAAIARAPLAVVCAGAKSVLDLPKTLEALESLMVPVIGVGTLEFPSFYSARSGLTLEDQVDDPRTAAQLLRARLDLLGQGGIVFAVPPPADVALHPAEIERHLESALKLAHDKGIRGKPVTPFLLSQLAKLSGGKTLRANVALLVNNARFAARLAVADRQLA